jgi:hypothetical protein
VDNGGSSGEHNYRGVSSQGGMVSVDGTSMNGCMASVVVQAL